MLDDEDATKRHFFVCVICDDVNLDSFVQLASSCTYQDLIKVFFTKENGVIKKKNMFLYSPATQTLAIDFNWILAMLLDTQNKNYLTSPYIFINVEFTAIEKKNTIMEIRFPKYSDVGVYVGSDEFNEEYLLCSPEKLVNRIYRCPTSNF
ncbi:MAG: hypothetical protein ACRCX2_32160 [Paraclostridium sp.]